MDGWVNESINQPITDYCCCGSQNIVISSCIAASVEVSAFGRLFVDSFQCDDSFRRERRAGEGVNHCRPSRGAWPLAASSAALTHCSYRCVCRWWRWRWRLDSGGGQLGLRHLLVLAQSHPGVTGVVIPRYRQHQVEESCLPHLHLSENHQSAVNI